ncbi:MAG: DUF2804 domain-containing protein [Bacilli bacterium]|nr:DUF2804 domain-containing protein [Bacilli bacterium]
MGEQHLLTSGPLLDEKGNLAECGYAFSLVKTYDRKAIKAPKGRIKEWDYYYVGDKERGIALTIDDNGYMDMCSCTVFDFRVPGYEERSIMHPFSYGKRKLPATSKEGDTVYLDKNVTMKFTHENGKRHLYMVWPKFGKGGEELRCDVFLEETNPNSMVIATPFKKAAHFYYNQKINCLRASGYAKLGDDFIDLNKDAYGVLDWGRGVWTYRNAWYWSSLNAIQDGHVIGWNLGYGFGDTKAASENMLFVDRKAYKLNDVAFDIPMDKRGRDDFLKPWRFRSQTGDIDLVFTPRIDRHSLTNALIIESKQHQVYGSFSGKFLVNDLSEAIEIHDLPGFAEKVSNRW